MPFDYFKTRENLYRPDPDTIARNTPVYGAIGRFAVLEGDEKVTYAERAQDFIRRYEPVGIVEEELVQMIYDNAWRIRRTSVEEQRVWAAVDRGEIADGPTLTKLNTYSTARERAMFRAISELRKLQADRRAKEEKDAKATPVMLSPESAPPNPPCPIGFVPSLCPSWCMFERFLHPSNPIFHQQPAHEQSPAESSEPASPGGDKLISHG